MSHHRRKPIEEALWQDIYPREARSACPDDANVAQARGGTGSTEQGHSVAAPSTCQILPNTTHTVHWDTCGHADSSCSHKCPDANPRGRSGDKNAPVAWDAAKSSQHSDLEFAERRAKCRAYTWHSQGALPGVVQLQKACGGTPVVHIVPPPRLAETQTVEGQLQDCVAKYRKSVDKQFEMLSQELSLILSNGRSANSFETDDSGTKKTNPLSIAPTWFGRRAEACTKKAMDTGPNGEMNLTSIAAEPKGPTRTALSQDSASDAGASVKEAQGIPDLCRDSWVKELYRKRPWTDPPQVAASGGGPSIPSTPQRARPDEAANSGLVSPLSQSRYQSEAQSVYELENDLQNRIIEEAALRSPRVQGTPVNSTQESLAVRRSANMRLLAAHVSSALECVRSPREESGLHTVCIDGGDHRTCFSDPGPGAKAFPLGCTRYHKRILPSRLLPENVGEMAPRHESSAQSSGNARIIGFKNNMIFASDSSRDMASTFPIRASGLLLMGPRSFRNVQEVRAGLRALLYQGLVMVIAISCSLIYAWHIASKSTMPRAITISTSHVADLPLAFGSVAGLASVGVLTFGARVIDQQNLMRSYCARQSSLQKWMKASSRDSIVTVAVWTASVIWRAKTDCLGPAILGQFGFNDARSVCAFAISTWILVSVTSLVLYMCRGMTYMVDGCCARFAAEDYNVELPEAAMEWNLLQSLVRRACKSIEVCFLILQATIFAACVAMTAELWISKRPLLYTLDRLVPTIAQCVAMTRVLFAAADVTNKCSRVPSLVAASRRGSQINAALNYFVNYVATCEAGFHICEIRLTSYMVMKFTSVLCATGFTAFSRLIE